eukprot:3940931-Pyramimonas_sp.AAC.1
MVMVTIDGDVDDDVDAVQNHGPDQNHDHDDDYGDYDDEGEDDADDNDDAYEHDDDAADAYVDGAVDDGGGGNDA